MLSYRNQAIDLLCKSIDWFLYEGNKYQTKIAIKNNNDPPSKTITAAGRLIQLRSVSLMKQRDINSQN